MGCQHGSPDRFNSQFPTNALEWPRVPDPLRFIPPQLATSVDQPPEGKDSIREIKYDKGYRCQVLLEHGRVEVLTRNGRFASPAASQFAKSFDMGERADTQSNEGAGRADAPLNSI